MKACENYVGAACVDGSCPLANREEYAERGMDVITNCDECPCYKGCDDCALSDMEDCCRMGKD